MARKSWIAVSGSTHLGVLPVLERVTRSDMALAQLCLQESSFQGLNWLALSAGRSRDLQAGGRRELRGGLVLSWWTSELQCLFGHNNFSVLLGAVKVFLC